MRGNVFATILVVLGLYFLLGNLGFHSLNLWELLRVWWPLIPICIGVSLFFTPEPKIKSKAPQQED